MVHRVNKIKARTYKPSNIRRAEQRIEKARRKQKRQDDGCNPVSYNLVNGQLFAVSSGVATQFSTNVGTTWEPFLPSSDVGDITTTFIEDNSGNILWANPAFDNGGALFCVQTDGTVAAVFIDGAGPPGCIYIPLNVAYLSSCGTSGEAAVVTGPAGPEGTVQIPEHL